MPDNNFVAKVCNICGSNEVTADGIAVWDVLKQEWVLSSLLGNEDCNECCGETTIINKPLAREALTKALVEKMTDEIDKLVIS